MLDITGTTWPVFVGVTIVLFGGAAFLLGQALGETWRPYTQALLYTLLLGLGDRFVTFALFQGELLSLSGYIVDTIVLMVIASLAYRMTRARKMVSQYPWLYERSGLFTWRDKSAQA
ncbi:MAG: hypothetical protein U1E53_08625 [Dongiaceae bacterium]